MNAVDRFFYLQCCPFFITQPTPSTPRSTHRGGRRRYLATLQAQPEMLRQMLRGVGTTRRMRSVTGAAPRTIGAYPTDVSCRGLAAAAAAGGKGKGASKDDAALGGAAAAAKLNALTMAIKRIEHLHGKGALILDVWGVAYSLLHFCTSFLSDRSFDPTLCAHAHHSIQGP